MYKKYKILSFLIFFNVTRHSPGVHDVNTNTSTRSSTSIFYLLFLNLEMLQLESLKPRDKMYIEVFDIFQTGIEVKQKWEGS